MTGEAMADRAFRLRETTRNEQRRAIRLVFGRKDTLLPHGAGAPAAMSRRRIPSPDLPRL
jgi:hypothetical protein